MQKMTLLSLLLSSFSGLGLAQGMTGQGEGYAATNPVADPFAANSRKPELAAPPLIPVTRLDTPLSPGIPAYVPPPVIPQGLRLVMIRGGNTAWLSPSESSRQLISVRQGGVISLGGHSFHAEISDDEVRLLSAAKGKTLWVGTLSGMNTPPGGEGSAGAVNFVPPLSAGVNPGLRGGGNYGASAQKP